MNCWSLGVTIVCLVNFLFVSCNDSVDVHVVSKKDVPYQEEMLSSENIGVLLNYCYGAEFLIALMKQSSLAEDKVIAFARAYPQKFFESDQGINLISDVLSYNPTCGQQFIDLLVSNLNIIISKKSLYPLVASLIERNLLSDLILEYTDVLLDDLGGRTVLCELIAGRPKLADACIDQALGKISQVMRDEMSNCTEVTLFNRLIKATATSKQKIINYAQSNLEALMHEEYGIVMLEQLVCMSPALATSCENYVVEHLDDLLDKLFLDDFLIVLMEHRPNLSNNLIASAEKNFMRFAAQKYGICFLEMLMSTKHEAVSKLLPLIIDHFEFLIEQDMGFWLINSCTATWPETIPKIAPQLCLNYRKIVRQFGGCHFLMSFIIESPLVVATMVGDDVQQGCISEKFILEILQAEDGYSLLCELMNQNAAVEKKIRNFTFSHLEMLLSSNEGVRAIADVVTAGSDQESDVIALTSKNADNYLGSAEDLERIALLVLLAKDRRSLVNALAGPIMQKFDNVLGFEPGCQLISLIMQTRPDLAEKFVDQLLAKGPMFVAGHFWPVYKVVAGSPVGKRKFVDYALKNCDELMGSKEGISFLELCFRFDRLAVADACLKYLVAHDQELFSGSFYVNYSFLKNLIEVRPEIANKFIPAIRKNFNVLVSVKEALDFIQALMRADYDVALQLKPLVIDHFSLLMQSEQGLKFLESYVAYCSESALELAPVVCNHFKALIQNFYGLVFLATFVQKNLNVAQAFLDTDKHIEI